MKSARQLATKVRDFRADMKARAEAAEKERVEDANKRRWVQSIDWNLLELYEAYWTKDLGRIGRILEQEEDLRSELGTLAMDKVKDAKNLLRELKDLKNRGNNVNFSLTVNEEKLQREREQKAMNYWVDNEHEEKGTRVQKVLEAAGWDLNKSLQSQEPENRVQGSQKIDQMLVEMNAKNAKEGADLAAAAAAKAAPKVAKQMAQLAEAERAKAAAPGTTTAEKEEAERKANNFEKAAEEARKLVGPDPAEEDHPFAGQSGGSAFSAELKGSIGEGPNHSNHSNHSNSFKIGIFRNFSLENSKISENFNIF